MRIKALKVLALFFLVFFLKDANAKTLFDGCVKGFSFAPGAGNSLIEVNAFPIPCRKQCEIECSGLSRKMDPGNPLSEELNSDVITSCIYQCRKGGRYAYDLAYGYDHGFYALENIGTPKNPKLRYTGPFVPKFKCDPNSDQYTNADHPKYNVETNVSVMKGADIALSMVYTTDMGAYMCGVSEYKLRPTIEYMDLPPWNNTDTLYPTWDFKSSLCTAWAPDWYQQAWGYRYNMFQTQANPMGYHCNWQSRNPYFYPMPLYPKDGDEVVISYTGEYTYLYDKLLPTDDIAASTSKPWTRKHAYKTIIEDTADAAKIDEAENAWARNSEIQIKPATVDVNDWNDMFYKKGIVIEGEEARKEVDGKNEYESVGFATTCDPDDATNYRVLGLKGCVIDYDVKYDIKNDSDCAGDKADHDPFNCKITKDPGYSKYIFYGTLNGYSSDHSQLAMRHTRNKDTNDAAGIWNEMKGHLGGYDLHVQVMGCPLKDGSRLQYTIYDPNNPNDTYDWKDIPNPVLNGDATIKADKKGSIYLRVKPMSPPGNASNEIKDLYKYGRYGKFHVNVVKINDSGFINVDGPIKKVVHTVYNTLFGQNRIYVIKEDVAVQIPYIEWQTINFGNGVIVQIPIVKFNTQIFQVPKTKQVSLIGKLYDSLIKDSKFINILRAFVLLYITFLGVGFMIGIIQMNQKELVVRSVKLAIVLALISETSWEFFSKNFFDLFIYGGVQIISYVATGSLGAIYPIDMTAMQQDPSLIFATFDGIFVQIFSADVWKKIGTYMLTGLMGFFAAMLIIIALVMYSYALIKAVLIYLMSLIMIAILIFIAPIMIPMMLFQITKEFFDNWWKMLLSFTLQPVAVFACITIFNILIAMTLYSALSATVCPKCYFSIPLPTYNLCLIPWYQMIFYAHAPEGSNAFAYPSWMFISAIVLLILVHAMVAFVTFMTRVVTGLITGDISDRGQNLGVYTGAAGAAIAGGIRGGASFAVSNVGGAAAYTAGRLRKGYSGGRGEVKPKAPAGGAGAGGAGGGGS